MATLIQPPPLTTAFLASGRQSIYGDDGSDNAGSGRDSGTNVIVSPIWLKWLFDTATEAHAILNVDQLSAITANLGTIIAGDITGVTITGSVITGGTINGTDINGVTITGGTITGTAIKSAVSGARVEIVGNVINFYDSADTLTATIDGDASVPIIADYVEAGHIVIAGDSMSSPVYASDTHDLSLHPHDDIAITGAQAQIDMHAETLGTIKFKVDSTYRVTIDANGFHLTSGTMQFGTHAALGAEVLSGYIIIKDVGGTSRKIGVIS
jgi:hypothetical protein